MTTRTKNLLGLLGLVLFAAATVWLVRRTQRGRVRALDAVPAGAFLVVTLDVDQLRASPLGEPVLGGPGRRLLSDETLAATCGFDPLERMREIAVAVPVEDESGEFGVAIRADVDKDELVLCARKVIDARGGGDHVTIRQSGSFTLVEPEGALARRYPTLAYREGGPFLVARGAWLGTMIDTAEGKLPSAQRDARQIALRQELGMSGGEHAAFALVATVFLPKEMRERIKKDMGAEVAREPGEGNSSALMAGVLGVESAGLGIAAGDAHGADTRAEVVLRCEDEPACAAVARVIEKTRRDGSGDLGVRMLGVGTLLDNLAVEAKGTSLRVSTHAPAGEAARWIERVLELRTGRDPTGRPPPATARPTPSSDEILRPDGGPAAREAGP